MTRKLAFETYVDKIRAGWLGKSIGGTVGATMENQKTRLSLTRETLWPDKVWPNDDLDIQVVWLEALQERGVWLTHEDLVDFWQDRCWYNFCEYGVFLHNVQRGIAPPLSGWWNNRFFRESEGSPIRSEIWGMIAPGNPELAASYARQDSELDHAGASIAAEMFLAAMAAAAFFETDLEALLQTGLSVLPADDEIARMVRDVREICRDDPPWKVAWRQVIRRHGNRDASKAITNQAIVVMSLLLGKGDFAETMLLACNSGWDTDCTAATAGALLGIMQGMAGLPADWVAQMGERLACDVAVEHKTATFGEISYDTALVGVEVALTRNPEVKITDAPEIMVRPQPVLPVRIDVAYPKVPVLWRERPTPVTVTVHNTGDRAIQGTLTVAAPSRLRVAPGALELTVDPGDAVSNRVQISNEQPDVVWDKNMMLATWEGTDGVVVEREFGLGGARQWLVYGPYWDMWDTTKNAVCPYSNDEVLICPNRLPGYGGDAWNQYARLDRAYLDETALAQVDLPEELPVALEHGTDDLDGEALAGFVGQAVFYLVRTLVTVEPMEAVLTFGSSAPIAIWYDGEEIFRRDDPRRAWAPQDAGVPIEMGPRPRRLVVKLARPGDHLTFSLFPSKRDVPGDRTVGHSMILDVVGDMIPSVATPVDAPEREA